MNLKKKIKKIADKYKLKVIQDSCHAIDAKYHGQHIVNFADACTFSMHPLKILTFGVMVDLLLPIKVI